MSDTASVAEAWPVELQLLTRLARTRFDDPWRREAADLVGRIADWPRFRTLARTNRVVPLVARNLPQVAAGRMPEDTAAWLRNAAERATADNRRVAEAMPSILTALAEDDIPAMLFKGPVLAADYGDLSLRQFADLDLLLPGERFDAGIAALARLGYAPVERFSPREYRMHRRYHSALVLNRPGGPEVDAHWRLTPTTWGPAVDYPALWRRSVVRDVAGCAVRTFADEDMLAYLALHAAKEKWHRLSMVADLGEFIGGHAGLDWTAALERATRQGSRRILLLAATLAHRLLDTPLPAPVQQQIAAEPKLEPLVAEIVAGYTSEVFRRSVIFRLSRMRLQMLERRRDRLNYLARTVLTPRIRHARFLPLPALLSPAYPAVKVVHDYLLLPTWSTCKSGWSALRGRQHERT